MKPSMTAARSRPQAGLACVALAVAGVCGNPVHADARQALRLQVEMAVAASSNPALDAATRRAAGAAELTLRVPYALDTERSALAIEAHANTRTYTTRELERARDLGVGMRWSTRSERDATGASLRLARRALDDRLEAGTGVFDVTRERDEGEFALDHVHSWTGTTRAQASARGTRIRHDSVEGADDLLDYDVLGAGVRVEHDLAGEGRGSSANVTRAVALDLDATDFRPSARGTRTRTFSAAASGRWQPTEALAIQGQGGLSHQRTSAGETPSERGDTAWVPGFDVTVRYTAPVTEATLGLARALRPTAAGGLTRNTTVALDVRHRVRAEGTLHASAAWTRIDASTDGDRATSAAARRLAELEGTTLALQAGVAWQVLPDATLDLSWRFARNDRGDGRAAHDHTARLALVYRPEGARW
jgi:hypothetical protein